MSLLIRRRAISPKFAQSSCRWKGCLRAASATRPNRDPERLIDTSDWKSAHEDADDIQNGDGGVVGEVNHKAREE
jgi:hypothetical protein